jgi:predicted transposase YdaD
MKILADDDFAALLSVVGVAGDRAERLNVELAGSTMKADLLARTPDGIVHVEFVKDASPDLDLRMVDYRLRLRRRHRTTPIAQYVLVLRDVAVPARYDDMDRGQLSCRWTVVRISERDPVPLLASPTTAPLAALARGTPSQRATVLAAAAELITAHADPDRRDVLVGAAATLASIVLPRSIITTALKEAAMPVPVRDTPLGRELYEEGRQDGRQEGRQEGAHAAVLNLTALMLRQRFDDDPRCAAVAARLADLPDEERLARLAAAANLDDLES